uniref:Uncharacterized protein n=1 Tax=Cacopsylla melanoneura TaxID=428564 RepID=A0A8D9FEQ0_9HEMI
MIIRVPVANLTTVVSFFLTGSNYLPLPKDSVTSIGNSLMPTPYLTNVNSLVINNNLPVLYPSYFSTPTPVIMSTLSPFAKPFEPNWTWSDGIDLTALTPQPVISSPHYLYSPNRNIPTSYTLPHTFSFLNPVPLDPLPIDFSSSSYHKVISSIKTKQGRYLGQNKSHRFDSITVLHQNLQSINNKVPAIEILLEDLKRDHKLDPEVLCFTETWMKCTNKHCYNIPGFVNISSYFRPQRSGGGVSIFTKSNLDFVPINIDVAPVELSFEFCGVSSPSSGLIIICVYRSNNKHSNYV